MRDKKMQLQETETLLEAFQPGDLLYGQEKRARKIYYPRLLKKLQAVQAKHQYVTIDEVNKPLEAHIFYANDYRTSPLRELPTPVKNHGVSLLSSEAFCPSQADILGSPTLISNRKFILACQFAIMNCTGTIHFCLDGLDLHDVRDPDSQKGYNSFTAQELRFIANNFEILKNKVKFYLEGNRVLSPWEAEQKTPEDWLISYKVRPFNNEKENSQTPKKDIGVSLLKTLAFLSESPTPRGGVVITPPKPQRSVKRGFYSSDQADYGAQEDNKKIGKKREVRPDITESESDDCQESDSLFDSAISKRN